MAQFDEPNISVSKKTNEENLSSIKGWAGQLIDQLNYLSIKVENLEAKVNALSEREE